MCGIVGFVNLGKNRLINADKIMPQLIFANQLRGRDATGVFGLDRFRNFVDHAKMVGTGDHFLEWKSVHDRFVDKAEDFEFMVAHNRAATVGDKKSIKAAHPHVTENITLVHNGTLHTYPKFKGCASDSHAIAMLLEEEPDFIKAKNLFRGAYALVWHDKRDQSLNFVRNFDRPFGFLSTMDDGLFFGSELDMVSWIVERPGNRKTLKESWQLTPYKWVKIYEDKTVEEIEVPFGQAAATPTSTSGESSAEKTGSSLEEIFEEERRAQQTLISPPAVKNFKDAKVTEAKQPPPPPPTPALKPEKDSVSEVLREGWSGITKDTDVYLYPVGYETDKEGKTVIVSGALALFVENGMEFPDGVRVRTRLKVCDKPPAEKIIELNEKKEFMCAKVTAVIYNRKEDKVIIYAKDAESEDWGMPAEWGVDANQPNKAFNAKYEMAASEVAAVEKKC